MPRRPGNGKDHLFDFLLSRQITRDRKAHVEIQELTAKHKAHGKIQKLTAKHKSSWQNTKAHAGKSTKAHVGKSTKAHGNI